MPTKSQPCNAMCAALALGCAGLAMTAGRLQAQDALSGFYLGTDAGLNLTSDLNAPNVSISLRPGVRGDAFMGRAWKVADELSVAAELDAGVLYNTLDKANSQGQSIAAGGSLTDVPLLAHGVLRWHFHPHWIAYAGVGAGGTFSSLHLDAGGSNFGLAGTEADFAWQFGFNAWARSISAVPRSGSPNIPIAMPPHVSASALSLPHSTARSAICTACKDSTDSLSSQPFTLRRT
jgi:hypothetical protein